MKRVFSPLHFNARSIGSICALLALPVLLGQAAFAGTVTFTDTPNDVASVVSATGFGTAAQGVITNNSCIDSHLIVTGSRGGALSASQPRAARRASSAADRSWPTFTKG